MTYDQLLELIKGYLETEETSFVENIPNFVRLAEERIYRFVKIPDLRKSASLVTTPNDNELTVPADFISADSLEVESDGDWIFLTPKDHDFLAQAYPSVAGVGLPLFYAQFSNSTIKVAPTPGSAYTMRLTYSHKPESIVDAGTSWIGEHASTALLYGSMLEAYIYLKGEPDLLQLYEGRFMEAVGRAKMVGEGRNRTDEWRQSPPVAPVS